MARSAQHGERATTEREREGEGGKEAERERERMEGWGEAVREVKVEGKVEEDEEDAMKSGGETVD